MYDKWKTIYEYSSRQRIKLNNHQQNGCKQCKP